MDRNNIITLPNPLLRRKSNRITTIDKKVVQLVKDMQSATVDWEKSRQHEIGVAMAAVQIGKLKRVVIIRQEDEPGPKPSYEVLLNPKITRRGGELTAAHEGCLSVPDLYAKVPRYSEVKVSALTLDGRIIRIKAKGFLARVLQHEIDHLDGKLFIDHVANGRFYKLSNSGKFEVLGKDELKQYSFLRHR